MSIKCFASSHFFFLASRFDFVEKQQQMKWSEINVYVIHDRHAVSALPSPSLTPLFLIHWSVSNLHDIFQILHSLFSFSHTISSSNQLPPSHNGDVFNLFVSVLFLFCIFFLILFVATFLFCSFYFCIRLAFVSVCFVISVQWTCFYLIIVDVHADTCVCVCVCVSSQK